MSSSKSAPMSISASSRNGVAPHSLIARAICCATHVSVPLWLTKTSHCLLVPRSFHAASRPRPYRRAGEGGNKLNEATRQCNFGVYVRQVGGTRTGRDSLPWRGGRSAAADLYAQGWTLPQIGTELGVHWSTVSQQLQCAGITMRSHGSA